jgi:hypothetical protein
MTPGRREVRHVELEPWEVGGQLLDILSRGLYSDARDSLREYVQNGVDAGASHIAITVDGPRVVIRDDGSGMDEGLLRGARRFGVSEKTPKHMVGYRGIGIYSSFGICEELGITSHQAGMSDLVGWRFQFGEMRRVLEADRAAESRQGVALANLLHQYSELVSEPYDGDPNDHFTIVQLEGLGGEYRAQLNDASGVNDYLLNTIPVAFPARGYGSAVNGWLREHVGLNPVRISLRIGDEPEFDVEPPVTENVFEPEFDWVKDSNDALLAFVWYALSTTGRQIPSRRNGDPLTGFLVKLKGFTLGNRLTFKPLWPAVGGRTLYHHYIGEVHILDKADVYPNAARDDLEPSPQRRIFADRTASVFARLNTRANAMRAMVRAERLVEGLSKVLEGLEARQQSPNEDPFELAREAISYLDDLETAAKELVKHTTKSRTRPAPDLTEGQRETLKAIKAALDDAIKTLGTVVRRAQRRKQRAGREPTAPPTTQPPPQVTLLANSLSELQSMAEGNPDQRVLAAVNELEPAVRVRSVPGAIGVLDDLKAAGVQLSAGVEGARKELRALIGWSPLAPISLEEALAQIGVSLETDREESLVRAVDRGLLAALGGRSDRYEMILRSIAEAVSDEVAS